jgi:hypothetical protein
VKKLPPFYSEKNMFIFFSYLGGKKIIFFSLI